MTSMLILIVRCNFQGIIAEIVSGRSLGSRVPDPILSDSPCVHPKIGTGDHFSLVRRQEGCGLGIMSRAGQSLQR